MYEVLILEGAKRDLLSLNSNEYSRVEEHIRELKNFPKVRDIKKLRGFKDYFRMRVGKYRVLFIVKFKEKKIFVVRVEKRSKAYRDL